MDEQRFGYPIARKPKHRAQPFTILALPFTIHPSMDNEQIARRFNQMAALMEIRGEDQFRLRSYRMAAEAIETWPTPVKEIAVKEGIPGLQEIPGIGKALAGKIVDLVERGTFEAWDRLVAETPETVLDLLELPGVGPKTAAMLHQKFKIASLSDLREFVAGGGLDSVDGIGPKTAERIKSSLSKR
jgi:DNA polymerase (family 10)